MPTEHAILLALPCGRDQPDIYEQSNKLQTSFITYLQDKQAAGIVNVSVPGAAQPTYVVHIFPPCDFATQRFMAVGGDFYQSIMERSTPYLVVVITTVV